MAKMMSTSGAPPSFLTPQQPQPPLSPSTASLPVRAIPGSYGWPLVGPLSDRLNYFWFQGPATFFRKRIDKYKSTVFRTNVPPTFPFFMGVNPNVVAVLDVKAFSHLFEMDVVEKKDVLVGDFMPSVSYTGGLRVCAYLDTTETKHSQLKNFAIDILKRSSAIWVPTLVTELGTFWNSIESEISKSGKVNALSPLQRFLFSFLTRCFVGADVSTSPEIAKSGHTMLNLWLGFQLLPTINIPFLQPLVEIFLHSFSYPFFLVSGPYNKLVGFIEKEGKQVIQRAKNEFGLTHEEVIHNLLFILGFNAYGGFSIFLSSLLRALGNDKTGLQERLRAEVREKSDSASALSFKLVEQMELVQSFVYETLRLNPPVPTQFARARKDFLLSSHDSVFEIKKGELLCGYQPVVMRDPKIFDNPETFVSDRFTKAKGKELLNYLYWSNGPQTGSPSESNKQCAGKEIVTLTASLFLAYMFHRYDSVTFDSSGSIVAVEKAK